MMEHRQIKAIIKEVLCVEPCGPDNYEVAVRIDSYPKRGHGIGRNNAVCFRLSDIRNWFGLDGEYSVEYKLEEGAVIEFNFARMDLETVQNVHFLPYKDAFGNRILK